MFLGVPGSGKSYFARQVADKLSAIRINSDSMRLAMFGSTEEIDRIYRTEDRHILNKYVFGGLDYIAEQIICRGYDVVYDAHQNKRTDREPVESMAMKNDAAAIVVRVNTPHEVAYERALSRDATVDQRKMTPERARDAIDRHQKNTDNPLESENVIDIDGLQSFNDQFHIFEERVKVILESA